MKSKYLHLEHASFAVGPYNRLWIHARCNGPVWTLVASDVERSEGLALVLQLEHSEELRRRMIAAVEVHK